MANPTWILVFYLHALRAAFTRNVSIEPVQTVTCVSVLAVDLSSRSAGVWIHICCQQHASTLHSVLLSAATALTAVPLVVEEAAVITAFLDTRAMAISLDRGLEMQNYLE
jgi:hypothetical protein